MKPFAHFSIEILLVWYLQNAAVKPLFMVRNLQDAVVKQFAHFSNDISMVLESPGRCCEAMIDGVGSPGGCCEAICTLFKIKYRWFWNLQEVVVWPGLMVWNLKEAAVKPFTNFFF